MGPAIVAHLDGSTIAKERLELILETLAGQVTVVEACRILDISEAMFYKLRNRDPAGLPRRSGAQAAWPSAAAGDRRPRARRRSWPRRSRRWSANWRHRQCGWSLRKRSRTSLGRRRRGS